MTDLVKAAEKRFDDFLSNFDDDQQDKIILYALDHVLPRIKGKPRAALAAQPVSEPANQTRSQKMAAAGFTRRPSIPPDDEVSEIVLADTLHIDAYLPDGSLNPKYTQPAKQEPMTEAFITEWWASENGLEDCQMCRSSDFIKVVRAIESAHGIGPVQEGL